MFYPVCERSYQYEGKTKLIWKLRNYISEYESLRVKLDKKEEEYIIKKSQIAFNSQNIKIDLNQNKEKENESSRLY